MHPFACYSSVWLIINASFLSILLQLPYDTECIFNVIIVDVFLLYSPVYIYEMLIDTSINMF